MLDAITDVKILRGKGATLDAGWMQDPANLNDGTNSSIALYLAYKRDHSRQTPQDWITDFKIVESSTPTPDDLALGWAVDPTNVNEGVSGRTRALYLAYKRGIKVSAKGGNTSPIIAIQILFDKIKMFEGYTLVDRDLNENSGGRDIFLSYMLRKYDVATLTLGKIYCVNPSLGSI
jgi:hypothetical protein